MGDIRVLQFSDLHLAAGASSGSLHLSDEAYAVRENEFLDMPRRICELAESEAVEMILIPGDLFDCSSVAPAIANEVIKSFSQLGVPIFVLPGNHDPYSEASVWNRRVLEARSQPVWGSNIFIFSKGQMQKVVHPLRDDVVVYGLGYTEDVLPPSPFPYTGRLEPDRLNILLLHGDMDMFIADEPRHPAVSFRAADIEAAGFDYAALGHYHLAKAVEEGRYIHAAFSGCPFGRGLDEEGPKTVIAGDVTKSGMRAASVKHVQLDQRVIRNVKVDVAGAATAGELAERVAEALERTGATGDDIIRVNLAGRFPPQTRPRVGDTELAAGYFHFETDASDVLPDYDLDEIASQGPATVEAQFVVRMRELIDKAPGSRQGVLRAALYLGLDAFRQEVVKPYAD